MQFIGALLRLQADCASMPGRVPLTVTLIVNTSPSTVLMTGLHAAAELGVAASVQM